MLAGDPQVDKVVPLPPELVVVKPRVAGVGEQDPAVRAGARDQVPDSPLALGIAEVDGDGALALFRPVQYRLVPDGASGQRVMSGPPPTGSTRMTSAPSWARVSPPSGAATKLETSTTRSPASGASPS